jgi:outer membrane protein assembly factor BamB
VTGTPAISGDTLYVVTNDGVLRAISLADWTELWSRAGYDANAAPAIAGDLVLAGAGDGALVARRISDGADAWKEPAEDASRVSVAEGRVAMSGRSSGRIKIVKLEDRTPPLIDESTGGAETGTAAQIDGSIYVVHRDVPGGSNGVDMFDAAGAKVWSWQEPEKLRILSMTVDDDNVYVLTDTPARVHALDRNTGDARWPPVDLGGALLGDGGVAGDLLYVVGVPKGLSAIDTSTGAIDWSVPLKATTSASRVVISGGLVIVSTTVDGKGRIVAFAGPADPRLLEASAASPPPSSPPASIDPSPGSFAGVRRLNEYQVDADADLIGGTLGPDGTLYVPDVANHRILVLDPEGKQRWWGDAGAGEGQFDFSPVTQDDAPAGIAVSPDGELIAVGEGGNHRIQLFDRNLKHITFIGRTGRGDGQFINPYPTISSDHRIWVVDAGRADVQVFDEAGTFLGKFPSDDDIDHELSRPAPVYVREDVNEVLVPDFGHRRVAVFKKDGAWLRSYEANSKERFYPGEVNVAMADPDGRVLVLDTANRLFFLDPDGHLLETLPLNEAFDGPDSSGWALSPTGRLFLVDRGTDRIIEAQLEQPFWPAD